MSAPAPPILDLAPPPKKSSRFWGVIAAGIASTALTLLIVHVIDSKGNENVMGWYANYILPVGALLVGVAASTGYLFAAWRTGLKIRHSLIWTILCLQILAYFLAHYLSFAAEGPFFEPATGREVGFWEYFHVSTILMSWKDQHDKQGSPLGGLGYLLRLGEIVGFLGGALGGAGLLAKKSYCELCERYMSTLELAVLPASTPKPGFLSRKKAGITQEEAQEMGAVELMELTRNASEGNAGEFIARLEPFRKATKAYKKLPQRIVLTMKYCMQCRQGSMTAQLQSGNGRDMQTNDLGTVQLSRDFVAGVLGTLKTGNASAADSAGSNKTDNGIVSEDLMCAVCGENLRLLPTDAKCPKCGTAVETSLEVS